MPQTAVPKKLHLQDPDAIWLEVKLENWMANAFVNPAENPVAILTLNQQNAEHWHFQLNMKVDAGDGIPQIRYPDLLHGRDVLVSNWKEAVFQD